MRFQIAIERCEDAREPRVVIIAQELTAEIEDLAHRIKALGSDEDTGASRHLLGYQGDDIMLLEPQTIYSFLTAGSSVQARLATTTVKVRQRLYELQERFSDTSFVRVSNSEIVNFDHVKSLAISIGGTLSLKFDNGQTTFVSRRYTRQIKEYLGL